MDLSKANKPSFIAQMLPQRLPNRQRPGRLEQIRLTPDGSFY
jgi:hypothetical protein